MPYDEFPQFSEYGTKEMILIIEEARLSRSDRRIAMGRLVYHRQYAEIAAELNRDRSGISRRLRQTILPRILEYTEQKGRG